MKIINQSYEILNISHPNPLKFIEQCGRVCYKSESRITEDSAEKFVKMLIKRGHHSVLEHVNITVKLITNRGVTHELVRHRLASYSQESSRYCSYKGDVTFIKPVWCDDNWNYEDDGYEGYYDWERAMLDAEKHYNFLLNNGWRPEQAREVLPNSLKTEIIMTCNLRELRHIFKLRCSKQAHPQIRALFLGLLKDVKNRIPVVFDGEYDEE